MMPPVCSPPFEWTLEPWGWTLACRALGPWHGWTSRRGRGGDPSAWPDWPAIAAQAGVPPDHVLGLKQVHGADVVSVSSASFPAGRAGDALVSADPGVILSIRVADCVPILLSDRGTGTVAAVHAGWRGTSAGIAGRAVAAIRESAGGGDIVAALGPSIGPCCYETGDAVREALRRAGWASALVESWFEGPERRHLDLWRANRDQLVAAGVRPEAVFLSRLCTACHPEWFDSYRRDGDRAGRMGAYIRAAGARW
jgi:YfiH family protein